MASDPSSFDLAGHKARAGRAWDLKRRWQSLYDQAYAFAIPYRRPRASGSNADEIDRLFDMTAVFSAATGAGQLKEDLFPSGQTWAELEPGPVGKLLMRQQGSNEVAFARQLSDIHAQVDPYFHTGEFDTASGEMCTDLFAGTGAILPMPGDARNPVRFACIPFDELAVIRGAFSDVVAAFWKQKLSRRAIKDQFPNGRYPDAFNQALASSEADVEIVLNQDFVRRPDGTWLMVVWLDDSEAPVTTQGYRTQPIAIACYHKVPGEEYGRGPILLAMPAIRTLNKAAEITLRAGAIQMLGIWGYRPGGTFNPDTARLAAGQFWAMSSTGGIMGPEVQRLDTGGARVDVGQMISEELRGQIRAALHDEQMPDDGKTPISAAEVLARMSRIKRRYVGAFGRMLGELVPVLVPRVMEILHKKQLLATPLTVDQLFVQIRATSPLANQKRLDEAEKLVQFSQIAAGLGQDPGRYVDMAGALNDLRSILDIPAHLRLTPEEQAAFDKAAQARQLAAVAAEAVTKKPEILMPANDRKAA